MLNILCALAVLASGKELNLENLREMYRSVGHDPCEEEIKGVLFLQQALLSAHPRDSTAHGAVTSQRQNRGNERDFSKKSPASSEGSTGLAYPPFSGRNDIHIEDKDSKETVSPLGQERSQGSEENKTVRQEEGSSGSGEDFQEEADSLSAYYLYGVAEYRNNSGLEFTGLEGKKVYLLQNKGLAAVVHQCAPQPYETEDEELAKEWVEKHNEVLEACMGKFPAVLPYTFNTILHDPEESEPGAVVESWLEKEETQLKSKLNKVRNNQEYGIQLLWDPELVAEDLVQSDRELAVLKQDMAEKSPGAAYMLKEKLERLVKDRRESLAAARHRELLEEIRPLCADYRVEKNKKIGDGFEMIGNWSCLVEPGRVEELGSALEEVANRKEYKVRFTGPWPPYSFVD
ncbi:MAG: hypothetical protein AVO34_04900 [Firmicutes bacterium ML8_F2]|jgi:hypothetical protein|nr:MAG: hypothetical protein AVO34_04900 [Firmicutes bacterium ML8_F2]